MTASGFTVPAHPAEPQSLRAAGEGGDNANTSVPSNRVITPSAHARPGDNRLRRPQEFVAVMRGRRRVRHQLLTMGIRPNDLPHNRFGFAIGKRVGGAVVRNRVRRRLREILRALPLAPGHDLVLTSGATSATATFQELRTAVDWCARRAGLLAGARTTGQSS